MVTARRCAAAAVSGLLLVVGGVSSCATEPVMHHGSAPAMTDAGDADGSAGPTSGPMSGHAMTSGEHDFLVTMIAHHEEAIVAAGQLERSGRPELRALGRRIIRSQSHQVRQMHRWLGRWYGPTPPATDYQPMMSDLTGLDGDALDRTFLVEMVHHHMMAVMMSRQLVHSGQVEHRQVARLATSVVEDQTAEIALMRGWLAEWQLL